MPLLRHASVLATLLAAVVPLAGCRSAPAPLDPRSVEAGDHAFQPPAAAQAPATDPAPDAGPAAPRPASAEELLRKEELTLAEVLAIVDARNPALAAARKGIDLATAQIWDARLYPNPSLELALEDFKTKDRRAFDHAKRLVGVGLPVVVSGRIAAATRVAEKEREIAAIDFVWRRREILTDAKRAFLRLLAARRNLELTRETRAIAADLQRVATERYQVAAIPLMEVLKADVNLARAETDVQVAAKDAAVALSALHALLGDNDLATERFAGILAARFDAPALDALRAAATVSHPLLESARLARESAELRLEQARTERIPDPELQVAVGQDGDGDSLAQAGVQVPLPLFNRNQGRIAAAEVKIRQAELELRAAENDLVRRLAESYREFVAAQERARAYGEEILPKAQQALELTHEGYRQGKFGYLDVLDAQRTLAEAKTAYTAALADLNLTVADLEKLAGARLTPAK